MKALAFFLGIIAFCFTIGFVVCFIKFERNCYNCVDGIRMIFFGILTVGFGNLAAIFGIGGKK